MFRMTSRDFNQDLARAKREAEKGPVLITDRGRPAFVLQRYEDWRRRSGNEKEPSLLGAVADTSTEADFEPPRISVPLSKPVDFD
jgi:prevent-host-death family protein